MRVTPAERLTFQRDLADTRLVSRYIYALVPVFDRESDFDEETLSGNDVAEGAGLGQTVSRWRVYAFYANVRNVDTVLKTFGQVPPGVEVGDVLISVHLRDKDMVLQVKNEPNAYLAVDGTFFRPENFHASGVGHVEEWTIGLRAFSPVYRAPGF